MVGHLGFAWNQDPTGALWNTFGYPIIAPGVDFGAGMGTGLEMVQSNSLTACRNDRLPPPSVGIGSTIESGGSGGPWILHFRQTLTDLWTNYAGGVSSYTAYFEFGGEQDYSPYFDQAVKDLKDQAVRTEP